MDVYDSIYDMYMLINTACNMLKTHIFDSLRLEQNEPILQKQFLLQFLCHDCFHEFSLGESGGQLSLIKLRGETCPSCLSLKKKKFLTIS